MSSSLRRGPTGVVPAAATSAASSASSHGGEGRSATPNGDDDGSADFSPELVKLLGRLRPFQREAFDFAVLGNHHETRRALCSIETEHGAKSNVKRGSSQPTMTKNKRGGKKSSFAAGAGQGRILLADEMGLGKTVTSLAIMTAYKSEWPLLILCPASLRHTWPSEIEKFLPTLSPSSIYVVGGFDDADFYSNPIKRQRIRIVVATYSLLQTRSAAARVLDQFNFRCVIADESHNLKERTSQRCKIAMPLLHKAQRLVLLSGTPALARPVELWSQLHCLNAASFGTYTAYTKEYCNARRGRFGWDVSGISNADDLHDKLRTVMVRRLKSNVLSELPPKQRSIVPIKITDPKCVKECREVVEDLKSARQSLSDLVGDAARDANFEGRKLLMQAYQASGIGKAKGVSEYVLDWLSGSGTQKVLVFAHHKEVLDVVEAAISKKFKGVGHIRIDGTVPPAERAVRVRKFQINSRVRVGLLSVTAAGVGLTLTAASSVIFAELHWTPGVLAQAEDRCHRIGQPNAVNIMYCVCKEEEISVDMSLWGMLGKKVGNLGRVLDGEKGASLNATEVNESIGVSAEEELSSFFAETTPLQSLTPAKQVPVKGSIESFFQKKCPSSSITSSNVKVGFPSSKPNRKEADTPSMVTPVGKAFQTDSNSSIAQSGEKRWHSSLPSPVTWTCSTCTYINSKPRPKSGWLQCEMCGTQYRAQSSRSMTLSQTDVNRMSDQANHSTSDAIVHKLSQSPSSKCVIEIDVDLSEEEDESTDGCLEQKSGSGDIEVIELDASAMDTAPVVPVALSKICRRQQEAELLSFSISKNSGRIAIHIAGSGQPLHINFDVEQVLEERTTDLILQSTVKRSASQQSGMTSALEKSQVYFNERGVREVVKQIDLDGVFMRKSQLLSELKTFVSSFLSLREVEKKALKDWGSPVLPSSLRKTLATIMVPSASNLSTDRYSGGAKERAIENSKNGCATKVDKAVLNGHACAWCGKDKSGASTAKGVESTYCSQKCAEEGRLRRGGIYASTRVRSQVFSLEGGVCRNCGIDAHALFLRISALQPVERLSALCNANWKLPKSSAALDRILQRPKEGDFWQADHIHAVAEGGGGCGLDNLQTLCTPCHKAATERLRSRLRLTGGVNESDKQSHHSAISKNSQVDIRSAFSASTGKCGEPSNPCRKRQRRSAD